MAEIPRRNFLLGTVATAATAAGLVLRAPAEAVELFRPTLEETIAITRMPREEPAQLGMPHTATFYDTEGRPLFEIQVRDMSWNATVDGLLTVDSSGYVLNHLGLKRGLIDVTRFSDSYTRYERG